MTTYEDLLICDECHQDVGDDAAPSCGSHDLHLGCAAWFGCGECDHIREEVPC